MWFELGGAAFVGADHALDHAVVIGLAVDLREDTARVISRHAMADQALARRAAGLLGRGVPLLVVLLVGRLAVLLAALGSVRRIAAGEQRFVFASQLAGIATTMIVGIATIPGYGAMGGAATVVASYLAVWFAAHGFAVRRVVTLPLFGVARPLAVAATAYLLRDYYAPSSLMAGVAALAGYVVLGPLLDRSFLADLRRILALRAKETGNAAQ